MTKTDALFYAPDGIRSIPCTGVIWTPLVEELARRSPEGPAAYREHLVSLHPLGARRLAGGRGLRDSYLATDESKFVTGSELMIDGGYTPDDAVRSNGQDGARARLAPGSGH